MRDDLTTITTLRNNAKAFGGVIGAEEAFFSARPDLEDHDFFCNRKALNLQDVTFV